MDVKPKKTFVRNDNFPKLFFKYDVYLKESKNNFKILNYVHYVQSNFLPQFWCNIMLQMLFQP